LCELDRGKAEPEILSDTPAGIGIRWPLVSSQINIVFSSSANRLRL